MKLQYVASVFFLSLVSLPRLSPSLSPFLTARSCSPANPTMSAQQNQRVASSKSSLNDQKDNDWSEVTEKPGTNGQSVFNDPLLAK